MKTKLLFTLSFLILLIQNSFSQAYVPMLNNSSWNIVRAGFGGQTNLVIDSGIDVVIGAYTYKKIIDPITNTDVFLREDVVNRKVYRNIGGNDQLLYDFSLQLNNTITLGMNTYTVYSIIDVNVNGGTRRKFNLIQFAGNFALNSETWIEGVGSPNHPLKPSYELPTDPYIYLTCSAQNNKNIYNHGLANGGAATDCSMLLSIDDINYKKKEINFYPNPFKTELLISGEFNFENATLKIFNATGQLVKEINNINRQNISIKRENLISGIYFVQLIENNKIVSTKKIIISDK